MHPKNHTTLDLGLLYRKTTTVMSDPESPVVLAERLTEIEATLLIGHLDAVGIRAMANGAGGATGWPDNVAYTQVVVRRCDLERAREAMESTEQESLLDSEDVDEPLEEEDEPLEQDDAADRDKA